MKPLLLDTGPIVALLDRREPHHEWVAPRFGGITGRMITTGAVVTEAMFFLQNVKDGIARLGELLETPKIEMWDCVQLARLRAAAILMEHYVDTPMDFADATLVVLANELETDSVLTLDERGFRTYRHGRNRPFHMVLQESP